MEKVDFLNNAKAGCIYCANCLHCKVKMVDHNDGHLLRVRCDRGKWKSELYKHYTVLHRVIEKDGCNNYDVMGEWTDFKKQLSASLPTKDILYPGNRQLHLYRRVS